MSKLKTNRLLELETKLRHNAIYIYIILCFSLKQNKIKTVTSWCA